MDSIKTETLDHVFGRMPKHQQWHLRKALELYEQTLLEEVKRCSVECGSIERTNAESEIIEFQGVKRFLFQEGIIV